LEIKTEPPSHYHHTPTSQEKAREKEALPDIEGRAGHLKPLGEGKVCQNGRLLYIPETQVRLPPF
jgi:hypothetical protein